MSRFPNPLRAAANRIEPVISDAFERGHPVMELKKFIAAIAKKVAHIRDLIAPSWPDRKGRGDVIPKPASLVNKIVKESVKAAVVWDAEQSDYPDQFTVYVSQEAWTAYYGYKTEAIGARLAALAAARLREWQKVDVRFRVEVKCNSIFKRGESSIEASFSGPAELDYEMDDLMDDLRDDLRDDEELAEPMDAQAQAFEENVSSDTVPIARASKPRDVPPTLLQRLV